MVTKLHAREPGDDAIKIADALREQGGAVCDDFITAADVKLLAAEAELALADGEFHAAGIGHNDSFRVDREERRDQVLWIDGTTESLPQRRYAATMEILRSAINRTLYLGLFDVDTHFALYDAGDFYKTHIDRFGDADHRTVSFIVYLNSDWLPGDGGVLRLYVDRADCRPWVDIEPKGGRVVCFLSERFPHEVLPVVRRRLAFTGWFSRRH